MNKAIFLDIDGVLNLFGESYKTNSVAFDTHFQEIITRMEFHLVKRLEYIINETEADIILISAWDLDSAKGVLKQNDFKHLDKLKLKLYSPDRVEGILEYIQDNNITDYIVLDDEINIPKALNLAPKEDRNSWVGILIKPEEGLTNEAATYAVKLLNRTLPEVY